MLCIITAIGVWSYKHFTQEVNGKTYREWHQLRTDEFKEIRRNFAPVDDMAKGSLSFQPILLEKYAIRLHQAASELPDLFINASPWGDAKETIWAPGSDFKTKLGQFVLSTNDLIENPPKTAGDLRQRVEIIRTQCIECHQSYRD